MLEIKVIQKQKEIKEVKEGDIIWNKMFNTYYLVATVGIDKHDYQLIRLDGKATYGRKMSLEEISKMMEEDELYKVEKSKIIIVGEIYK